MADPSVPPANPLTAAARAVVQQLVFPFLSPVWARDLANAFGHQMRPHQYVHCNLKCQSSMPSYLRPRLADWLPHAPPELLGYGNQAPWGPVCNNQAKALNLASADAANPAGYIEPSYCVEPAHVPRAGIRLHNPPTNQRPPLVCTTCKDFRAQDLEFRRESLRFGVCRTCKTWALANLQAGQNDCMCEPAGNYVGGVNNNEARTKHLCRFHDYHYWDIIKPIANREIDFRRRAERTRVAKRGHGWTRKKQHGPKPVRTPAQRRAATRLVGAAPTGVPPVSAAWQTDPRCYCGEVINAVGHERDGPDAPFVATQQVRNCVGCNEFVRRW